MLLGTPMNDTPSPDFVDNTLRSRFELTENGLTSFANYRRSGDVVTIPHVESPVAARGTGAAGRLMTEIARHARDNKLKVVPICSYAVAWFRKHPAYSDILE